MWLVKLWESFPLGKGPLVALREPLIVKPHDEEEEEGVALQVEPTFDGHAYAAYVRKFNGNCESKQDFYCNVIHVPERGVFWMNVRHPLAIALAQHAIRTNGEHGCLHIFEAGNEEFGGTCCVFHQESVAFAVDKFWENFNENNIV